MPTVNPAHAPLLDAIRDAAVGQDPAHDWVVERLAFLHVGGSTLYGTSGPASDLDVRGVTIPPKSYWVGARTFEHVDLKLPGHRAEAVIYDFRKWLRLVVHVNPNVVETLFVDPAGPHAIVAGDAWPHARAEATALLNRHAHAGYHGYTTAQLKKMIVKHSNQTGRREIAERHGFDLKFAAHAFRLARQGAELLRTGTITFPRPDRDFLRAVRAGAVYGPDDLDRCVADLEREAADLDRAYAESVLPEKADFDRYDRLLVHVYDHHVA